MSISFSEVVLMVPSGQKSINTAFRANKLDAHLVSVLLTDDRLTPTHTVWSASPACTLSYLAHLCPVSLMKLNMKRRFV